MVLLFSTQTHTNAMNKGNLYVENKSDVIET